MLIFLENLHAIGSILVTFWLGIDLLVVSLEVTLVVNLSALDEADIDVGTGSKIVVHTSFDGLDNEILGLILSHTFTIASLKDGHSCQRTGSHGEERSRLVMAIGRNFNKLGSTYIDASND